MKVPLGLAPVEGKEKVDLQKEKPSYNAVPRKASANTTEHSRIRRSLQNHWVREGVHVFLFLLLLII